MNIYGSSKQLVAQYRSLMDDMLLSQSKMDVACEERNLSLLTKRFAKTAVNNCITMLKDVRDSHAVM